jgi:hypothetical protein
LNALATAASSPPLLDTVVALIAISWRDALNGSFASLLLADGLAAPPPPIPSDPC